VRQRHERIVEFALRVCQIFALVVDAAKIGPVFGSAHTGPLGGHLRILVRVAEIEDPTLTRVGGATG
jgi:hypothetical protein